MARPIGCRCPRACSVHPWPLTPEKIADIIESIVLWHDAGTAGGRIAQAKDFAALCRELRAEQGRAEQTSR